MEKISLLELEGFVRSFSSLQLSDDEFLNFCLTEDLTQKEYDLISHYDGGIP